MNSSFIPLLTQGWWTGALKTFFLGSQSKKNINVAPRSFHPVPVNIHPAVSCKIMPKVCSMWQHPSSSAHSSSTVHCSSERDPYGPTPSCWCMGHWWILEKSQSSSSVMCPLLNPPDSSGSLPPYSHRQPWSKSLGHRTEQKGTNVGKGVVRKEVNSTRLWGRWERVRVTEISVQYKYLYKIFILPI